MSKQGQSTRKMECVLILRPYKGLNILNLASLTL